MGPLLIERELQELRTETGKVFLAEGGSRVHVIHGKPIHYRYLGAGAWLDIDTAWEASQVNGFDWQMVKAGYNVYARAGLLSSGAIAVFRDGTWYGLHLHSSVQLWREDGTVTNLVAIPSNVQVSGVSGSDLIISLAGGRSVRLRANNHRLQVPVVAPDLEGQLGPEDRLVVPLVLEELGVLGGTYFGETADGRINGRNATYATARSTSYSSNDTDGDLAIGQYHDGTYYRVVRSFVSFNTAALSGTVTAATLYAYWHARVVDGADFDVVCKQWAWQEPLGDYREANFDGALGSGTTEGDLLNTGGSCPGYASLAVGTTRVNTSGDTKYVFVSQEDLDASPPGVSTNQYIHLSSADTAGTGEDPYLVVTERLSQACAGALSSAGALARRAGVPLAGAVATAGALAASLLKLVSLAGVLAPVGGIARRAQHSLAGVLTEAGELRRRAGRALAGAVSSAGTLLPKASKVLAGVVSSVGALVRAPRKVLAGVLSPAGGIARVIKRVIAGVLEWIATLTGGIPYPRELHLFDRSLTLSLDDRGLGLTLHERCGAFTLEERSLSLTLHSRSLALTLEDRE